MCKYNESDELVSLCWECDGVPPECGHNHHTPCNKAWKHAGMNWELNLTPEEAFIDLEEHVRMLLAKLAGRE